MDFLRRIKLLNRKKTDPGKFIYTGAPTDVKTSIQRFRYAADFVEEENDLTFAHIGDLQVDGHQQWVNIHGLTEAEQIATLCKKQGIDNLVIQDILDLNQRPKFQEYDTYCFLTIKSTVPSEEEMIVEQVSLIFGKNYLISFQEKPADYFDHLRYRLREKKGILRERGPDFLLYTMLEAILDNYFRTLDRIRRDMDQWDLSNIKKDPSPSILEEIERYKVFVQFVNHAIHPIKEFVTTNERQPTPFIEERTLKYLYEIKDLCLTLMDDCHTIISSLDSSINLFFSVQGHRMNQVMKTLTIVATIFIPLTFIAGVYGMNFAYMPELQWRYGYLAVWILIILVLIGMLIYFRQKRWF